MTPKSTDGGYSTANELPGLVCEDEEAIWDRLLDTKEIIRYKATDIRKERTGMHAVVGVFLSDMVLGYSNFNITRQDERTKLINSCYKQLSDLNRAAYNESAAKSDLDLFCLWIMRYWEERKFVIGGMDPNEDLSPLQFPLKPYIIEDGGTILFSAPGGGKSYILQIMAVCVTTGRNWFWPVQQRPSCYINLERPEMTLKIRERAIRKALQIDGASGVDYIHARGSGIGAVAKKIIKWRESHPNGVLFLDSVSRSGSGKLKDDDTGNNFIDAMNSFKLSWIAIGHTPKADGDTIFGSQMFSAGVDIAVKVTSQRAGRMLGLRMEVVKANDIGFPKPFYMALDFGPSETDGLEAIRVTSLEEFPEFVQDESRSMTDRLMDYIRAQKNGLTSATDAADALKTDRANISRILNGNPAFQKVEGPGREKMFGISSSY